MKRLASIILILFVEILYPNHFFSKDSIINHSVLLKNTNNIIPLRNLDTLKIASLNLSSNNLNVFEKSCDKYSKLDHFHFNTFSSKTMVRAMLKVLKKYNLIVIVTDTIQQEIANMINKISVSKKIILNYLGGNKLEFEDVIIKSCQAIIYDDKINNENLSYAGQVIFGGLATNNYLKTDLSENFRI